MFRDSFEGRPPGKSPREERGQGSPSSRLRRNLAEARRAQAGASRGDERPLLEALPVQYADFAVWQRQWLRDEVLERQLAYWKEQLGRDVAPLMLPADRPRPPVQSFKAGVQSVVLPDELGKALKELSRRQGVTVFMTLLAGFETLLYRYTGQTEVAVGTPIANRNRAEIEGLIGFFVNTLVLQTDLSGDPRFTELLSRVREVALGAYAHQDLPFEKLVEELQPERDLRKNPLFQVLFAVQNAPMESLELPGLTARPMEVDTVTTRFDLEVHVSERMGSFQVSAYYATDLFDAATVERLLGHYQTLLEGVAASPGARLSELPLLSEVERRRVLVDWNATATQYADERLVHRLFESRVRKAPDGRAVSFEGRHLTYDALNRRANQLAHYLMKLGVGPEQRVGICAERSFDMVVAILATLKAGGAYVPLDPTYPRERLTWMLEDADLSIVLTKKPESEVLPAEIRDVVFLDEQWDAISREKDADPDVELSPANAAYVIFTSGSTGRPKGAINTHGALVNRLLWMQSEYGLTERDTVLQKTLFSFDVSVWEFLWPLGVGACLVVAEPGGHQDPAYLVRLIRDEEVTTIHFVPSMLRVFLEDKDVHRCTSLKRVICSGEELTGELRDRFYSRLSAELHNLYGPTEAAIDVTYWHCERDEEALRVPIGRPVANTKIYLLDGEHEPVPVGVVGELFIGGAQVARGYIGKADLTAETFIPDAFSGEAGARLYRTGDLARYRADGGIEYIGRIDHQVKIRGFRIELQEIELALNEHRAVSGSVVVAWERSPGDPSLAAYIVAGPNRRRPSVTELREHLKKKLPDFMVPAVFVFIDSPPLTPSGKVDRRALPPPEGATRDLDQPFVSPRTRTEDVLAKIWTDVLGLDRVGIQNNFFELGGHSLLATRVISRVNETFQVDLPLRRLFENPTIAGLAEAIEMMVVKEIEGMSEDEVLRLVGEEAVRLERRGDG